MTDAARTLTESATKRFLHMVDQGVPLSVACHRFRIGPDAGERVLRAHGYPVPEATCDHSFDRVRR